MKIKIETSLLVAQQIYNILSDNSYFIELLEQQYSNVWESIALFEEDAEELVLALNESLSQFGDEIEITEIEE